MLVFLALIPFITMRKRLTIPPDKALLTLRGLKAKVFDQDIRPLSKLTLPAPDYVYQLSRESSINCVKPKII